MKDFTATQIEGGLIRLDLIADFDDGATLNRFCEVIDIPTAMALAVLLIQAIEKAEVNEAITNKKGKKK